MPLEPSKDTTLSIEDKARAIIDGARIQGTLPEMLATMEGAAYLARTSVHNVKNIIKTKKAIKKAFEVQQAGLGFSLVEILSACPTNWRMTTKDSLKWIEEKMIPYYGLKVTKDVTAKK